MPTNRIFINILDMLVKIAIISYNVIIKRFLPNVFFVFSIAIAFEGRDKTGYR